MNLCKQTMIPVDTYDDGSPYGKEFRSITVAADKGGYQRDKVEDVAGQISCQRCHSKGITLMRLDRFQGLAHVVRTHRGVWQELFSSRNVSLIARAWD